MATVVEGSRRLKSAEVQSRYGICDRTLDRWLVDPQLEFPRPLMINRQRYFDEQELVVWERERAKKSA
jgi:predicted DNA-binding transcriptional regulator AlpA